MRQLIGRAPLVGATLVAATLAASASHANAQRDRDEDRGRQRDDSTFNWTGRIPAGSWVRVHNLNGGVRVVTGTGDETEVRAEKTWRRGDPRDVRFEVVRDGSSVVICALWYERSTCDESGMHTRGRNDDERDRDRGRDWDQNNDVAVEFTVRLPRGVKVLANTVNGNIDIRDARAEVEARSVNGQVEATTSTGPVSATTVNGSVRVQMDAIEGSGDLKFGSVNGSVIVEAPARLDAEVELSTVNGGVRSDYPITTTGRFSSRHLRGTLGSGGRRLTLTSVNGAVELRKL
ncbi:MAG: DUF4097 family beta strand repeat-containing protein [Gemmatimonadaceae bacterium]